MGHCDISGNEKKSLDLEIPFLFFCTFSFIPRSDRKDECDVHAYLVRDWFFSLLSEKNTKVIVYVCSLYIENL